ncbi:hypothetical protein AcdelDRAFT_0051 [Acidovorax delafieldii 2AN]|jgi:hypothetical protein|uniref:Uncharacterized protein n=1 Tax=Acidovorax delafieldii 2AN TaxID=573060 RepID=C5SZH1_ACIDE|nr:hypothetical protein [Acidovorax delafieldii]EER62367.1 hypothetical protein AcdelDRAFT_0051 [Acidovorax delafieldii 2AN]
MKKTATILLLAVWTIAPTFAEPIEGVLEKGPTYSALFGVSPESGDLIGHAFKNQSAAGKAILGTCLPGMFCKVGRAVTRVMTDSSALNFEDRPSGWFEVTQARDAGMETVTFGYEKSVKTRHGILSVDEDNNSLLLKGQRVLPGVEGNSSLRIVAHYEIGRNDVVLLQNNGGTACPALFRFVTVAPNGSSATPEFGTCSDIIYPSLDHAHITVAMTAFLGPFEPPAAQKKAAMTKVVYTFSNGQVTENGKVVRP